MTANEVLVNIALSLIAFLGVGGISLLCYFLKGIYDEMRKLNNKLIEVITNQEWHYNKINELDSRLTRLENKGA